MLTLADSIEGIFVKELKNRFLCEVLIDGVNTVCYVPSSCRLGNFLDLEGKKVLLFPTAAPKSRTDYALFAVGFKKNYILLNPSQANRIVEENMYRRFFSFLGKRKEIYREYIVEGYKTDLYINDTGTLVEIKSVISTKKEAIFPTVFSQRTLEQLENIYSLLQKGFRVAFIIVSLSPYTDRIILDKETSFYEAFCKCVLAGMQVMGVSSMLLDEGIGVKKQIEVVL